MLNAKSILSLSIFVIFKLIYTVSTFSRTRQSLEEHGWYCSFLYLVDYIDCSKAIQVSYSIQDDKTYERETKALIVYAKRFDCKELFIITMDEEEEININDNIIHVMPLWKMLLKGI